MRKYRWIFPVLAMALLAGCQKEKEERPLIPDEMQEEEDDKVVQEPEPTEEPVAEYEVELPEKLSSFAFGIWGEKYQLPLTYEQFLELGWTYRGDDETEVEPEAYIENEVFEQGGCQVEVDLINTSGEAKKISECCVGGITMDLQKKENAGMALNLPSDIVGLESLKEDVLTAYGTPKDTYEESGMSYLTYEYGMYRTVMLGFRTEDEVLTTVDLQNYRSVGADMQPEDISKETPEEVKNYTAPEEMGENFASNVVRYADTLYTLPAPVQAFVDDGWKVLEEESDAWVKSGSYGYITLAKSEEKVYIVVYNYSGSTVEVKNCFVTTLYGDLDTTKVPIEAAGAVTLGMSENAFLEAAGEQKYEKSEEEGKILYTYYLNEAKKDYTEITVDAKLHLIRGIKVVHNREEIPEEQTDPTDQTAPETEEKQEEETDGEDV